MSKINFTKEHMIKLRDLSCIALFENRVFFNKLGVPLNIVQLLHTVSINQLIEMKATLAKKIEKIEGGDEWISPDNDKLSQLKDDKELINLAIGWKRFQQEKAENIRKKEELTKKLTELKESTKTPEDRIKEMEAALAALDEF